MAKQYSFSKAVEGFVLSLYPRHLSEHTVADYMSTIRKFQDFLGDDPPIDEITTGRVKLFLAAQEVSNKTVLNYHTGLLALWTWAVAEGLAPEHIVRKVPRPKPEKRAVKPFSEVDVRSMLGALSRTRAYTRPGKRSAGAAAASAVRWDPAESMLRLQLGTQLT